MDATEVARQQAEQVHAAAIAAGDDPLNLLGLALQEASRRDLDVFALPVGDAQLKGGRAVYDSQAGVILYEDSGTEFDRAFLVAHELGHVIVDGGTQDAFTEQVEPDRSVEDSPIGIEKVVDYGAKERREVRMDLFARELLLPRAMLLELHIRDGLASHVIAERFGAPVQVIQQQLLDALLLPVPPALSTGAGTAATNTPDPSQSAAANHRDSPYLLEAGPGTGKTRTLVQRIERLLADGADPAGILVLTFSNKAAKELSERLTMTHPTAAAAMWIGTFHAFGLDIIRRFYDKLGLPPDPRLIDRSEAIELLEDELPRLPLRHFRNLWDPTLDLSDMLAAISRAKDEVVNAAGYRALAQGMLVRAGQDEDARKRAEKCMEVATLFETYEALASAAHLIDFGDLVALPVRLVEADANVRQLLAVRHRHILVDEYQDVNRASVRLLKAIVGDGRNFWAVGDARQSIYRFRGASATNMALFTADFPGAHVGRLDINYRSTQDVVDIFTGFAATMSASVGALPLQLIAQRTGPLIPTEFWVTGTQDDEISALAASIQSQFDATTSYRNQAVLCVSNARLGVIAEGLESRGIPVLHLGSLFERPEIKDLLALLSMLTDPHAPGLVRAASLPGCEMPLQDIVAVIAHLRADNATPLAWRQVADHVSELSAQGRVGFERIAKLFEGLQPSGTPWSVLTQWVLDRLDLAKALYGASDPRSRMQGIALWQFLNFCRRQPPGTGYPCVRLLDRIRRLILIAEDRSLRHLPSAAAGIDAVRLMTIHGSKGLEFDVVHLPGMVASSLPRNNTPPRCVPPDGLIHGAAGMTGLEAVKAGHEAEEECLFFVALSRARNRLILYASSRQSGGRARSESNFIRAIERWLQRRPNPPMTSGSPPPTTTIRIEWQEKPSWNESQVGLFERCPRRFLYTHVLKLGGRRIETPFMKMHNVVSEMFGWLKSDHETTSPAESETKARFDTVWAAKGATDHGYEQDYRRIGMRLVDYLVETRANGVRLPVTPISLGWAKGDIQVHPDSLTTDSRGQMIVGRVKTGKPRSEPFDDIEYTILQLAAVQTYGPATQVAVTYLTSESVLPVSITARKLDTRRQKLAAMIDGVATGEFPAQLDARQCPRCPSFFICGKVPDGTVAVKKSDPAFRF